MFNACTAPDSKSYVVDLPALGLLEGYGYALPCETLSSVLLAALAFGIFATASAAFGIGRLMR